MQLQLKESGALTFNLWKRWGLGIRAGGGVGGDVLVIWIRTAECVFFHKPLFLFFWFFLKIAMF